MISLKDYIYNELGKSYSLKPDKVFVRSHYRRKPKS